MVTICYYYFLPQTLQVSQSGSVEGTVVYQRPPPLSRSQTDSNIQYSHEEAVEAPGSAHYITRDGHINLTVLLKVTVV